MHTRGKGLNVLGLNPDALNDARNVMRLCRPIEMAFDKKDAMIVPEGDEFILVVLNPALMDKRIQGTRYTFKDRHKQPLQFQPGNIYPYRRLLAVHAHRAICKAVKHNWDCDYADPLIARRAVQEALGKSLLGDANKKVMEYLDSYDRAFA